MIKTNLLKTIRFLSSRIFFFLAGLFCFIGVFTVLAAWPSTAPHSETLGGWLGEVFDLGNSTSTKIILKNTTTMGIGDSTPDGDLTLDVAGQIGATEYCDQNGANCKTANLITTGPGTTNYLTKWTGATTQGNSVIYQDGTDIGIGDSTPDGTLKLDVAGQIGATAYCDSAGNNCKTITDMGTSGTSFTYYCFLDNTWGTPVCSDAGGTQRYCPTGYKQTAALGIWGSCYSDVCGNHAHHSGDFLPPGGTCGTKYKCTYKQGRAYICSK